VTLGERYTFGNPANPCEATPRAESPTSADESCLRENLLILHIPLQNNTRPRHIFCGGVGFMKYTGK